MLNVLFGAVWIGGPAAGLPTGPDDLPILPDICLLLTTAAMVVFIVGTVGIMTLTGTATGDEAVKIDVSAITARQAAEQIAANIGRG